MSMNLFDFGHPCEHQLKRTCIGGQQCPLNGYPDNWCCSFVKGRINFKRDKPCEGARCRWGFEHPTNSHFEAVTNVLNDGRAIAQKLDDALEQPNEVMQFKFNTHHYTDTVHSTLQFLRTPPKELAHRIGQLMACAALKNYEARSFTLLLKTMKKPVDPYVMGAYEFVIHYASQLGKKGGKKANPNEIHEELRSDIVDVMNSALSQHGQLVDRPDQQDLQVLFISALKTFSPKNKKKREMLEAALAKFSPKPAGESPVEKKQKATPPAEKEDKKGGAMPVLSVDVVKKAASKDGSSSSTPIAPSTPTSKGATPSAAKPGVRAYASVLAGNSGANKHRDASTTPPPAGGKKGITPPIPADVLKDQPSLPSAGSAAGAAAAKSRSGPPTPPAPAPTANSPPGLCETLLAQLKGAPNPHANELQEFHPICNPSTLPDVAILGGLFGLRATTDAHCGPAFAGVIRQPSKAEEVPSVSASGSGSYALFGPLDSGFGAANNTAPAPAAAASSAVIGSSSAQQDSSMMEGVLRAWGQ